MRECVWVCACVSVVLSKMAQVCSSIRTLRGMPSWQRPSTATYDERRTSLNRVMRWQLSLCDRAWPFAASAPRISPRDRLSSPRASVRTSVRRVSGDGHDKQYDVASWWNDERDFDYSECHLPGYVELVLSFESDQSVRSKA